MKTLELNQMETLSAGSCAGDSVALGLSVLGVVAAAASGPFGWAAAISLTSAAFNFALLIADGECF